MSDEAPTVTADPFAPAPLDEEIELRALVRALELSEGFKLIFARCNQIPQRLRLMDEVRGRLAARNIQVISLTKSVTHLLDELRQHMQQPAPDAVFVTGLEYSLPVAAEAHNTQLVANLNASRNSFPHVFPCPLVLWVSDYILAGIMLGAPDFFSIRSGMYAFVQPPSESVDVARELTSGYESAVANLSVAEKHDRVRTIENLLADYQVLPAEQRDKNAEMRLHFRLGTLYADLGLMDLSLEHYDKALDMSREIGNREYESWALGNLGIVYEDQGRLTEAGAAFKESLQIAKEINDLRSEGISITNLGNISRMLGQLTDAEEKYLRGLEIYRELGMQIEEGAVLGNLGVIYEQQGDISKAESYYNQSLSVSRKLGDRAREANALYNFGTLLIEQGRLEEAKTMLEQSLQIISEVGGYRRVEEQIRSLLQFLEESKNPT